MGEKVIEKAKTLSRGWKKVKGRVKKSVVLNIQNLINNMPWRVAAVSAIGAHEKTNIYIDCTKLVLQLLPENKTCLLKSYLLLVALKFIII